MLEFFSKKNTLGSFIDNQFVINRSKTPITLRSCVTNEPWLKIHQASELQIASAIQKSHQAYVSFRNTSSYYRAKILRTLMDLIRQSQSDLARIITTEMGKTYKEAFSEIEYGLGYFDWFADAAMKTYGYEIPSNKPEKTLLVTHEAIGPSAIITPWNFPFAMAARKIAPAIAAGCTVVVKPSPETPMTLLALAELFKRAKLPPSVLQVLIGNENLIGKMLSSAKEIRKISFTGSTKVGIQLYEKSAKTLKKATLELGGNAPLLVFNDANISLAVEETIKAKFRNHGQSCVAVNRILLQKKIAPKFIEKFVQKIKELKVGNPFREDMQLTNVLHIQSRKKIKKHIEDALRKGAKLILKGKSEVYPHVLINCTKDMLVFNEETFGPLASIFTFDTDEHGITLANTTPYGLAAYLFTKDIARIQETAKRLEYGMIGVNDGVFSTHQIPFGGIKASGFGREGGPFGIYEYLVEKTISIKHH
ncbi:MAG: NAD-dependent succinate-semialdehyde dehydrogenase [Chlamydiota bacterium]|jgi:succinate-semialdehyde dehydrogenase/glutarate-semialdehyde dehydrogenase